MKWIPLEKNTLIIEENYRCLGLYKGEFVILMHYHNGEWTTCGIPAFSGHSDILGVTHFMPLPKPPCESQCKSKCLLCKN